MSLSNLIEIATDEKQTEDDWTKILDVCECGTSNPKECLRLILRRMFSRNPHVVLRSLILLDACVQNIGESFAKEISSRYFVTEIKSKSKNMHQKALERLCSLIKKWSKELFGPEFDPFSFINELNKWLQLTYPICYAADNNESSLRNMSKSTKKSVAGQEEADIARAIALSLKETESKKVSLYPSATNSVHNDTDSSKKSQVKVRALYDFEAAEENELTFKAGEIIINVDTSNEHWWTGSNHRGEGMFPAQFVTMDLDVEVDKSMEKGHQSSEKKDTLQPELYLARPSTPVIEESRIDDCIRLIEDADPTGEMRPDPAELAKGEAQCRLMGPLIDQELEKVDRHYNRLAEINRKIIESFQMYNELMTQSGMTRPTSYMWPSHHQQGQVNMSLDPSQIHSQQMYSVQQLPQSMEQMRFQSMNYYTGAESIVGPQDMRSNAMSMNLNQSLPLTGYPLPPHMSQDKDRSQFPPPSSNNNAHNEPNLNLSTLTYPMHNNFVPANYPHYTTNDVVDPNVSFVQK